MAAASPLVKMKDVKGKRLIFPEWKDARIIEAADILRTKYKIEPLLLNPADISSEARDDLARTYSAGPRSSKITIVRRLLERPLFLAAMLVKTGEADAMVAGAAHPTKKIIEAGMMAIGLADGITVPSSFFLMRQKNRSLIFADCAVNIDPSAEELCDITLASAKSATQLLGSEPRIAFLSFSTHGSANHASVTKIQRATAMARAAMPDLAIDGELQVDAALDPGVAAKKLRLRSDVAGRANVLIFPNLDAANIGYKLVQYLGGAQAIGPVLQGFAKPVTDLSRGATVQDIVDASLLTASMALTNGYTM